MLNEGESRRLLWLRMIRSASAQTWSFSLVAQDLWNGLSYEGPSSKGSAEWFYSKNPLMVGKYITVADIVREESYMVIFVIIVGLFLWQVVIASHLWFCKLP